MNGEKERVLRGLYLLQAKLLEALAMNRQPEPAVASLADDLSRWWTARVASKTGESGS